MNDFNKPQDEKFDNEVCDLTDQILSSDEELDMMDSKYAELADLQKAIVMMKQAVRDAQPDAGAASRMRMNIMVELQKDHQDEKPSLLQSLVAFLTLPRVLAVSGVAVMFLLVVFTATSFESSTLAGAAMGDGNWLVPTLVLGALFAIIFFFSKNRHS